MSCNETAIHYKGKTKKKKGKKVVQRKKKSIKTVINRNTQRITPQITYTNTICFNRELIWEWKQFIHSLFNTLLVFLLFFFLVIVAVCCCICNLMWCGPVKFWRSRITFYNKIIWNKEIILYMKQYCWKTIEEGKINKTFVTYSHRQMKSVRLIALINY